TPPTSCKQCATSALARPPITSSCSARRRRPGKQPPKNNAFAIWLKSFQAVRELNNQTQKTIMAHVVTSKCVGCKFTDCVEVCPVACFYELDNQVLIHPEDCIDCTACVSVCPVEAIYAESDVPAEFQADTEFNATQARQ